MWKQKAARKLSRERGQRKALLLSLARELFLREKITTTQAKAKEVTKFAQRLIAKLLKEGLSARRELYFISPRDFLALQKRVASFKERKGGYTRITKLAPRKSDGASRAVVELIQ